MVAATPQMCWDVSIVCGKCVGGGVLLGRMLRSCTRFQVFARMTCCWSEKSCCYVSKTRASLARNAYCKTNMSSSAMPFTIPPVLCQNTIRYHHFDSLFEKYEKKNGALDSSSSICSHMIAQSKGSLATPGWRMKPIWKAKTAFLVDKSQRYLASRGVWFFSLQGHPFKQKMHKTTTLPEALPPTGLANHLHIIASIYNIP